MVFILSGKNYALHICIDSINCRINLTTNSKPNPLVAPNFCMFLRKHIIGKMIKSISSYDLERVINIELEGYNELNDLVIKKLNIELMGKHSNIILLNSNNIILDSARHIEKSDNSYRDIMPTREYTLPVTNKFSILQVDFDKFYELLNKETIKSISKKISSLFIGISKNFIDYSLTVLNVNEVNEETINILFTYLQELISLTNTDNVFCTSFYDSNNKDDYSLAKIKKKSSLDINFFLDDFYNKKENSEVFLKYRNNVLRTINNLLKKYKKRLENINSKLEQCANMSTYKKYGELITSNLYRIENKNIEFVELEDYYDNNKIIKILLDNTISPSKNAKNYFKKYHKLKNTLSIVSIQKQETKKELEYIESIIYELEAAKSIEDIDEIYTEVQENILGVKSKDNNKSKFKKSKKYEVSPFEYEVNGYKVLVGKNNKQNDYITFKLAEKTDLWFHTKDIHGSHLILKTNRNVKIDEDTIKKCSELAAKHSRAKNSSNIPVDYTLVKFVRKPSAAKPGKVVYVNQNTIYVKNAD